MSPTQNLQRPRDLQERRAGLWEARGRTQTHAPGRGEGMSGPAPSLPTPGEGGGCDGTNVDGLKDVSLPGLASEGQMSPKRLIWNGIVDDAAPGNDIWLEKTLVLRDVVKQQEDHILSLIQEQETAATTGCQHFQLAENV